MLGKTIGHYQILEKLGEGGMGVVYKARDTHLDRFVALKILPAEKVADPDRRRRFVQEAKAASALNHPHIVTIYDIDEADGVHFIAMEYVDGKTLDQLIPRHGMRLNEALKVAVQLADALAAAHEAGIVHRDLKPGNLMVTEKGQVKVLDFGLAKLTEKLPTGAEDATLTAKPDTEEGKILGTVAYMSPEQAEGKKVDARSDIFSFGSVFYEMVTGRRAFQGNTPASTQAAILKENPKPASQVVEALPKEVERMISRCLRKERERRWQTMADLKVALEELKEESDSGALETPGEVKPKLRHRLIWAIGVAAALVFAAVAVWFIRSKGGAPEAPLVVVPLTSYPGSEEGPSFSPDGRQVAFAWNGEKEDNWDIYVKLIGSESYLRLTTDPAPDSWPAWSPDGRQIAFCRDLGAGKRAVVLISPLGGPERILTEFSFTSEDYTGPFLSWSPDGRALAMVEQANLDSVPKMVLYMMETGEKLPLGGTAEVEQADSCPAFSPDGRTLAFCRWASWVRTDLYLLDLSQDLKPVGGPRRLTFEGSVSSNPAWVADGSALVYPAGGALWRVAASGSSKQQRMASIGEDVYNLALSRQTSRLAFCKNIVDYNIWRIEIPSHQRKANPPTKFISSTRFEGEPHYSPDGKKIVFASERSGSNEIWVCDADGSRPIQLTHFGGGYYGSSRWSPDSSRLTFELTIDGHSEVYVINASGGTPRRLPSSAGASSPSWSKDGRWIYFNSIKGTEKIPAGGGAAVLVNSTLTSYSPLVESPDGKFFYATRKDVEGYSLLRTPVEGGKVEQVLDSLTHPESFAVVDNGIYYVPRSDPVKGYSIRFLELATGKSEIIAELGKQSYWSLSVSPDRRWILYTQQDQAGSDLMLVENFH
jgi:serine/threonine protein kinase/Tol biopolymer transport system component